MARFRANDAKNAFALDDLTVAANPLN